MQNAAVLPDPNLSEFCIFKRTAGAYLANSPAVDPAVLRSWRPARSFYGRLRRSIGLLPGVRSRSARISGHNIRFWDLGARGAPAAVLLHGFSASKENWINIVFLLSRSFRVLVPDIPGFGESSFDPDADYRLPAQGERMAAWFASLGIESAHWAGSSMGGAIAGIVAALEPRMVRSLTLMNSAGVMGAELTAFERDLFEGKNGLIASSRRDVDDVFRLIISNERSLQSTLLSSLLARDQVGRAPVYHHLFRQMVTAGEFPSPYWTTLVRAPSLILWGERDKVLHPCEAEVFRTLIPGSKLVLLKGVGHLPMLEAPLATSAILRRFWLAAAKPD
jgi:pimeloyl-ACP methyl ester carboxylesterase